MRKLSKIAKLLYRKTRQYGSLLIWSPVYLKFYIKGHGKCFNIFTHLTIKERLLLYKLALSLPKNSICVEIGSYLGGSACFLASAAKEKGHKVYCVDTWKNEGMSEGERDTFDEFLRNIEPLKGFIVPLRGYSVDVAKSFDKEIDLIFIDGDHSYHAVKADVESWIPKVKNGGIVVFHDIGWAEGVQKVVEEYIKPIQLEEHILDNTYWARIKKWKN